MDFQTRYEFDPKKDLLGKGGFSKVYKANDILLERIVALKFFTAKTAEKYQILNEIKKVIRFEHPNLCKYYDVALLNYKNVLDETEQMEVGIMEYIDSGDLKTYLKKNPEHTDKLLIDVLKGLSYLHKHGMAHRDLKPQNILIKMVDEEPVSKITDFGISKLIDSEDANSSALLGTIEYMAPEQFNPKRYGVNGRITTNLDLWSFGLLIYEVICHRSLFGSRSAGISAEQVMSNILSDAPLEKAEALPPKYKKIVMRCLVKSAVDRVHNALELIPMFQGGETSEATVQIYPQPDSGKITLADTQVIGFNLPAQDDEKTETDQPAAESSVIETKIFDLITEPNDGETQLLTTPDNSGGDTQILEPDNATEEITQTIDRGSMTDLANNMLVEELPEVAEEKTQLTSPDISMPVVKENIADNQWYNILKSTGQKKPARKPVKKAMMLLIAAVLLVAFFIAYPFISPSSKPVDEKVVHVKPQPVANIPAKPEMVNVAGGTFMMGDAKASAESPAFPAHEVSLDNFSIGKYEVTVYQFRQFINDTKYVTSAEQNGNSDVFLDGKWDSGKNVNWQHNGQGILVDPKNKTMPVVHVSWNDATAYCQWLSKKHGVTYRLPTEAEWEFAARGGTNSKQFFFSGSDNIAEVGWYDENSGLTIQELGKKKPNELGIYDMSGNVSEWCYDWYDKNYYKSSDKENPSGPNSPGEDRKKVFRGGAWGLEKIFCQVSDRVRYIHDESDGTIGFRICRVNK
jgi:formylglycine-generating enzyme required for sulfatase activity/tRNA A-37 threonylcarbamoyl transferase component Bud32